jgi:hypothetical protein
VKTNELIFPITIDSNMFINRKPIAILFGKERLEVKTWTQVYTVILKRCNSNPTYHEKLMYLRNKVRGKCRVFLSDTSDGMRRPAKIDEDMYGETHYGSATLMHILLNRILTYTGFDSSNIRVVIKT